MSTSHTLRSQDKMGSRSDTKKVDEQDPNTLLLVAEKEGKKGKKRSTKGEKDGEKEGEKAGEKGGESVGEKMEDEKEREVVEEVVEMSGMVAESQVATPRKGRTKVRKISMTNSKGELEEVTVDKKRKSALYVATVHRWTHGKVAQMVMMVLMMNGMI